MCFYFAKHFPPVVLQEVDKADVDAGGVTEKQRDALWVTQQAQGS